MVDLLHADLCVCVRVCVRILPFAYPKPLLNRLNCIIVWIIHTDVRVCVQFAEKFAEYKEAARLAKEKSQEKTEMAKSPSQVGSGWVFVLVIFMSHRAGWYSGVNYKLCIIYTIKHTFTVCVYKESKMLY